jgi:hypothetical protein
LYKCLGVYFCHYILDLKFTPVKLFWGKKREKLQRRERKNKIRKGSEDA